MASFDLDPTSDDGPRDGALAVLWRRKWLIAAIVILLPLVVYVVSSQRGEHYEADAVVQIEDTSTDASILGTQPANPSISEQTLAAAARLVETRPVAEAAARQLGLPVSDVRSLLDRISVATDVDAGFLTITGEDARPTRAAEVANAFASALIRTRTEQARAHIDGTIDELQGVLARLPSDDAGREQLVGQVQRLRTLRALRNYNAEVVDPATPPADPSSPRPRRDTFIAFMLAVLLAAGLATLLDRLNRRVRDPLEVERIAGAPLLAAIPSSAFVRPGDESAAQAFHALRANLGYLGADETCDTIVVASALRGEGRTTVAHGLATAYAGAGKSAVLVDADLRTPRGSRSPDLDAETGLSDVLEGRVPLDEAIWHPRPGGHMRVLRSGSPAPNSSDLLALRMPGVLAELARDADVVIIDTPPTLIAADATMLFEQVSGVVLIARIGRTTPAALRQLARAVPKAGGNTLGVIATDVKPTHASNLGLAAGFEQLRDRASARLGVTGVSARPRSR